MSAAMGIYAVLNRVTGRVYVGQSIDIPTRWGQHRRLLAEGRHKPTWQREWDEHGEGAYSWQVVELVADPAELDDAEGRWVRRLGADEEATGYNVEARRPPRPRAASTAPPLARPTLAQLAESGALDNLWWALTGVLLAEAQRLAPEAETPAEAAWIVACRADPTLRAPWDEAPS